MEDPIFLSLEDVMEIHADQIDRYGGSHGLRDLGLLEAALGAPQAWFGGEFLHPNLHAMAAAYLFHLANNHPFVDGNKRVASVAALVFLRLNGMKLESDEDGLVELVLSVAQGKAAKPEIEKFLRAVSAPE